MSRQGCLVIAILGGPLLLGMATGIMQPADVEAHLLLGWMKFLYQTIPQVHLEAGGFLTAGLCLLGLTFGGHWFLSWLYEHGAAKPQPTGNEPAPSPMPRRWRFKWTIYLLLVVVVIFAGGISAVGIFHQVAWLIAGK